MKLNRKQRRANWRRPSPTDSPAQQMQAFLKSPGKFHIVQLPEGKSFVVKVTEPEMPIFLTICQQLRGVLGLCEAIPATPVEASVADTNKIAQQTADDSKRIREARQRQDTAEQSAAEPTETDSTLDQLVAMGPADSDEGAKRIAAMKIAAAQDAVARQQEVLDAANEQLRQAFADGGDLHNRAVLDRFAERASEQIAAHIDQDDPETLRGLNPPERFEPIPGEPHKLACPMCPAEFTCPDKTQLVSIYTHHINTAHKPPLDPDPESFPQPVMTQAAPTVTARDPRTGKCPVETCNWEMKSYDVQALWTAVADHMAATHPGLIE